MKSASSRRLIFAATVTLLIAAVVFFFLRWEPPVPDGASSHGIVNEQITIAGSGNRGGNVNPVAQQSLVAAAPATKSVPVSSSAQPILAQDAPPVRMPERELFSSRWGKSEQPQLAAFARWVNDYLAASLEQPQSMIAQGIALAEARRKVMAELIKAEPREAIANTPPIAARRQLPAQIESQLEKRISDRGDLYRVMGLPQPGVKNLVPTVDQAQIGENAFAAYRYGSRTLTPMLKDVSIHGVALDKDLAVLDSPVRKVESGETPAQTTADCVVTDNKKVVTAGQDETSAPSTVMLVGNHGYTLCCPFCAEDFETWMKRLEQQALTAQQAVQAISRITCM